MSTVAPALMVTLAAICLPVFQVSMQSSAPGVGAGVAGVTSGRSSFGSLVGVVVGVFVVGFLLAIGVGSADEQPTAATAITTAAASDERAGLRMEGTSAASMPCTIDRSRPPFA